MDGQSWGALIGYVIFAVIAIFCLFTDKWIHGTGAEEDDEPPLVIHLRDPAHDTKYHERNLALVKSVAYSDAKSYKEFLQVYKDGLPSELLTKQTKLDEALKNEYPSTDSIAELCYVISYELHNDIFIHYVKSGCSLAVKTWALKVYKWVQERKSTAHLYYKKEFMEWIRHIDTSDTDPSPQALVNRVSVAKTYLGDWIKFDSAEDFAQGQPISVAR